MTASSSRRSTSAAGPVARLGGWLSDAAQRRVGAARRRGLMPWAGPSRWRAGAGGLGCCWPSGWVGRDARRGDGREQAGEDVLGGEALGQRLVGQHEAVAQHVGGDVEDVLGQRVGAAPQQGEGPGAGDEAEAGPGAGAVADELGRARAGRSAPGSRVASTRLTA